MFPRAEQNVKATSDAHRVALVETLLSQRVDSKGPGRVSLLNPDAGLSIQIGSLKLRSHGSRTRRKYRPMVLPESRHGWIACWGLPLWRRMRRRTETACRTPHARPVGRLGVQKSLSVAEMRSSSRYVVTQATSPPTVAPVADDRSPWSRPVWHALSHTRPRLPACSCAGGSGLLLLVRRLI